jgi:hypothetical protein
MGRVFLGGRGRGLVVKERGGGYPRFPKKRKGLVFFYFLPLDSSSYFVFSSTVR